MTETAVVIAVLAALVLIGFLVAGTRKPAPRPRPAARPPSPRTARVPAVTTPVLPAPRRVVPPPEDVRRVLARRLDADWEQAQRVVRQAVADAEHEIRSALREGAQVASFQAATDLHRKSWQTADRAHGGLTTARSADQAIGAALSHTHESARLHGGRPDRATLDVLHGERAVIRGYRDQYKAEVDELNLQTRNLKHHIRDNFGEHGRRWYADLEERTRRRQQERNGAR